MKLRLIALATLLTSAAYAADIQPVVNAVNTYTNQAISDALQADAITDAAALAAKDVIIAQITAAFEAYKLAHPDGTTPPPPPPPPPGGFVWKGLQTVFPTAATTGPRIVTVASTVTNVSGIVTGKKFTQTVHPANGTKFIDCEFAVNDFYAIDGDGKTFSVDFSLFSGKDGAAAILGTATVTNSEIMGWQDGIKEQGSGWIVRGNYIHAPFKTATSHNDGVAVQWSNSDFIIEQNRIEWTDTSEIFMQKLTGTISNCTVRWNWLGGSDLPLRIETGIPGCKVTENIIKKGFWGYWDLNNLVAHSGNIDSVTGASID